MEIVRSNSREYDNENKTRRHAHHSRNNSRDMEIEFRQKLTHSRNNSKDDHNSNIKFILNYLNTTATTTSKPNEVSKTSKKHSRNHSYDQIYMPNNIKIDQELHNKFNKNLSRKNSRDPDINIIKNINARDQTDHKLIKRHNSKTMLSDEDTKLQHPNSKDMNLKVLMDEQPSNSSVLRHRRTSSKDLSRIGAPSSDSSKHTRNSSQHKIQIEQELESAQFLLRRGSLDADGSYLNVIDDNELTHV